MTQMQTLELRIDTEIETKKNKETLTYADIKPRLWTFETDEGKYLLSILPEEIQIALKKSFLQSGLESDEGQLFLSYLLENSKITQMVKMDSTSSLTFEYLYLKEPVINEIDKYFPMGGAAKGIFERLQALKANLPEIIRQDIKTRKIRRKYHVLNIGSGPGHDIIETLQQNPDLAKKVQVTCLDPDGEALAIGKKKVEEIGLIDSFTFIQEELQTVKKLKKADMIMMIGLLCPKPTRVCKKILKNMTVFSRHNGIIVFSTVQNNMIYGDPLTDFIMRADGWSMCYKTDSEPDEIALESGWDPYFRFFDSYGYNCMTVARIQNNLENWKKRILFPIYKIYKGR